MEATTGKNFYYNFSNTTIYNLNVVRILCDEQAIISLMELVEASLEVNAFYTLANERQASGAMM